MPEIPEDHARAAADYLNELIEVIGSVGRHEGHTLSKAGRCVYCSCGLRAQISLPTEAGRAECREIYAKMQAASDD